MRSEAVLRAARWRNIDDAEVDEPDTSLALAVAFADAEDASQRELEAECEAAREAESRGRGARRRVHWEDEHQARVPGGERITGAGKDESEDESSDTNAGRLCTGRECARR